MEVRTEKGTMRRAIVAWRRRSNQARTGSRILHEEPVHASTAAAVMPFESFGKGSANQRNAGEQAAVEAPVAVLL